VLSARFGSEERVERKAALVIEPRMTGVATTVTVALELEERFPN